MSVKRCANCEHPIYQHDPNDLELCRIEACPCPGFLTPSKRYQSVLRQVIQLLQDCHHHHGFPDTDCTPANCSIEAFLDEHLPNRSAPLPRMDKAVSRG